MDPITALGAAAAVVQFVDYATTLFSGTYRIYKLVTGDNEQALGLLTVTKSLKSLSANLQSALPQVGSKSLSSFDKDIVELCKHCTAAADQLISGLSKLQVQEDHSFWEGFRRALQTVWGSKEVDSLERRLGTLRSQISLHLTASLRCECTTP